MNNANFDKLVAYLNQYPTVDSSGIRPFSTSSETALSLDQMGFRDLCVRCDLSSPDKVRFIIYPGGNDKNAQREMGISVYINLTGTATDDRIKATLIEAVKDFKKPEYRQSSLITKNVI